MCATERVKKSTTGGWFAITHILIANLQDKNIINDKRKEVWVDDISKEIKKYFPNFSIQGADDAIYRHCGKSNSAIYIFGQQLNIRLKKKEEQCFLLIHGDFSKDKVASYHDIIDVIYRDQGKHYAIHLEYINMNNFKILTQVGGKIEIEDFLWPTYIPLMEENTTIPIEHGYPLHVPNEKFMQISVDDSESLTHKKYAFCKKNDENLLYAKSHAVCFIEQENNKKTSSDTIGFCPCWNPGNNTEIADYIWLMLLGKLV